MSILRRLSRARPRLANRALQIYPGKGMTCVFDQSKALCQLRAGSDHDDRHTPDLDDCRPSCRNIARTDRDMALIHQQAADLQSRVDDPLSPPIRHQRGRRQLHRLHQVIADHEQELDLR